MTTEKMTVHKALAELKVLDDRILVAIGACNLITTIAIQEINKGYPRQKTNQHSRMDESARKPEQYHAEAGVII